MASLRNLGGDRWQVRIYAGLDEQGRQQQLTRVIRAKGERAALRESARVEAELRARKPGRVVAPGTLGELADRWAKLRASQPSASPTTIARQRYFVERIKRDIGGYRLDRLEPHHIDEWYSQLRKGDRSESTVHHYHRILKAIIRQGHKWGQVDRSVIERVTAPVPRRRRVDPPSADAVASVLEAAPPHLGVMFRVFAATGARRSEVLGLRWGDLDGNVLTFRRAVVEINGQPLGVKEWLKNPDEPPRAVVLDAATASALAAHRSEVAAALHDLGHRMTDSVYVFPDLRANPSGRSPRRPGTVTHLFAKACAEAGVKMRLHDLRHWHATQLIDAGVPITDVSQRLGHAQVSTTLNVYAHAARKLDDRAAKAIGKALPKSRR